MPRFLSVIALTSGLAFAQTAFAFDPASMSDAEREAFRGEIRAYLLDNPEVLMEAMDVLNARQAEAERTKDKDMLADNAKALFDDGYSWVGGNPEGDVTLVEFMDYRCGYCRRAFEEVAKLVEQDGNIRLVIKEFPILGEASTTSARFAIATLNVAGPEAYEAVHNTLITLKTDPSDEALRDIATTLDLDADAILAGMDTDAVTQVLKDNMDVAQKLNISGTPTFAMKGELLRGYVPLEEMKKLVQAERDSK